MNVIFDVRAVDEQGYGMPVAAELVPRVCANSIAGYFYRSWGTGARFTQNRIEHGCPMVLWAHPGVPVLHWAARIVQNDSRGTPPSGTLRLVANPEQPAAVQGGLSALADSAHVDLNALGLPDRFGGWSVGGRMGVHVPQECLLAVRLQGVCQNMRVLWSAISQAHRE